MKISFGNMAHNMSQGMHMGHGSVGGRFHVVHHVHNVHHIHVQPRPSFKSSFGSRASRQQFTKGMSQGVRRNVNRANPYHNTNKTNIGLHVAHMIQHDNRIKSMQRAKDQRQERHDQKNAYDPNRKSLLQQMIDDVDAVGQHMQRAQRWRGPQR